VGAGCRIRSSSIGTRFKPGRLAIAGSGAIFLDEIGDISPAMQARLLRVPQEWVYEPLGSVETVRSDIRVVTATNKNLAGPQME
jgi:transcriptional regulator with PAS, ATPase and Fis domain